MPRRRLDFSRSGEEIQQQQGKTRLYKAGQIAGQFNISCLKITVCSFRDFQKTRHNLRILTVLLILLTLSLCRPAAFSRSGEEIQQQQGKTRLYKAGQIAGQFNISCLKITVCSFRDFQKTRHNLRILTVLLILLTLSLCRPAAFSRSGEEIQQQQGKTRLYKAGQIAGQFNISCLKITVCSFRDFQKTRHNLRILTVLLILLTLSLCRPAAFSRSGEEIQQQQGKTRLYKAGQIAGQFNISCLKITECGFPDFQNNSARFENSKCFIDLLGPFSLSSGYFLR